MSSSRKSHLYLFLVKNTKIVLRQKFRFGLSIFFAFLILTALIIYRSGIKSVYYKDVKRYEGIPLTKLLPIDTPPANLTRALAFCPENQYLKEIVRRAARKLELDILPLPTEGLLEKHLLKNKSIAGIVFDENTKSLTNYPKKLSYKLRFTSKSISFGFFEKGVDWRTNDFNNHIFHEFVDSNPEDQPPPYKKRNFIIIQHAIMRAYIDLVGKNNSEEIPDIVLRKFPQPPYVKDDISTEMPYIHILISFIFAFPSAHLARIIAEEKRKQFKLVTNVMGIKSWLYWTSWFIWSFCYLFLFAIGIILVLKIPWMGNQLIQNTSTTLLILLFVSYIISLIMFIFMFGIIYSSIGVVYIEMLLSWFIISIFTSIVFGNECREMSLIQVIFMSMSMNIALELSLKEVLYLETINEELNLWNFWSFEVFYRHFSFVYWLISMLVMAVIYMFIALYADKLLPNVDQDHWLIYSQILNLYKKLTQKENRKLYVRESFQHIFGKEMGLQGKTVGLETRMLYKYFGSNPVVKDINMKVHENELTAILAHSGGGKTIITSLLTGILQPTKGNVYIYGNDIFKYQSMARQLIGYCPSFDALPNELTVEEYIHLFYNLKGTRTAVFEDELLRYAVALNFETKLNTMCKHLTNVEKKKVSLCVALCGKSKVVICDEPTAGLDPFTRGIMWNILQKEKFGRTILAFTSFATDAEMFADRIGILIGGSLRGYGDLDFLRKKLGGGYLLICKKRENCKTDVVTEFLKKYVPLLIIESEDDQEIIYSLTNKWNNDLRKIVREFAKAAGDLKILDFELYLKTMEELIMRIGTDLSITKNVPFIPDLEILPEEKRWSRRWKGLFFKKLVYSVWSFWTFARVVIFVCTLMILANILVMHHGSIPLITFKLNIFQYKTAFVESYANETENDFLYGIVNNYKNILGNMNYENIQRNFEDYYLEKLHSHNYKNERYLVIAATFNDSLITAWYNEKIFHTGPLSLNLVHNALVRQILGKSHSIEVSNAPLPVPYINLTENIRKEIEHFWGCFYAFLMAFITSLFVTQPIVERNSDFKDFQLSNGIQISTLWMTTFIWDYVIFGSISVLFIIVLGITKEYPYPTESFGTYYIVFMIFGFSAICFTYLCSTLIQTSRRAYAYVTVLNIFTGFGLYLLLLSVNMLQGLTWIIRIFPHYTLAETLMLCEENYRTLATCISMRKKFGECRENEPCFYPNKCKTLEDISIFRMNGIGVHVIYFVMSGLVYFTLLFIYENGLFKFIHFESSYKQLPALTEGDESAIQERHKVMLLTNKERQKLAVVMDQMTKFYGTIPAVNRVSAMVREGEIFAIVGPIGSGKSTILKQLTGAEDIFMGNAYIRGVPVAAYNKQIIRETGYAPRYGGLVDFLTGRDALQICCFIRGVQDADMERVCLNITQYLGIINYLDTEIRYYGGSNKRKLCLAMSAIANVNLVFFDQPSFGCVPATKIKIWDFILELNRRGTTVIFATSEMSEAFRIATRIAFIVNGQLASIGIPAFHVRNVPSIIVLNINIKTNDDSIVSQRTTKVKDMIENVFPNAELRSEFYGALVYVIPRINMDSWGDVLEIMQAKKEDYKIARYSVSASNTDFLDMELARRQLIFN